jgi:small multidrug resistance pump
MTPNISHFASRSQHKPAPWMKFVLFAAAAYNALWGAWVGLFPKASFDLLGMTAPAYLPLWQSVGLMVGCYAIGYFIAAFDPYQYWALILVGFIGKVLGPLGMIYAVTSHQLPLEFAWNNLTNDVIWWIPFFLILRGAFRAYQNQDITEDKTKT